jgi:hypothetical protein
VSIGHGAHGEQLVTVVTGDEREQLRIAAVLRCLVSTQAWLRMREEFGVPGTESGPVVAWVIDTIIRELRAGNTPSTT